MFKLATLPKMLIFLLVVLGTLSLLTAACSSAGDSDAVASDVDQHEDDQAAHVSDAAAAEPDDHDEADHADEQVLDAHDEDGALDAAEARVITVRAGEFAFEPREIHVTVGETVRLILVNEGTVLHDITAFEFVGHATAAGSTEHAHSAEAMGAEFHTAAETGATSELVFTPTEAGEFQLVCTVPGHEQLGMTAVLVVDEA